MLDFSNKGSDGISYLSIFDTLYPNKDSLKFDKIAYKFNINIRTLYGYRVRFNLIAEYILELMKDKSFGFSDIDKEESSI